MLFCSRAVFTCSGLVKTQASTDHPILSTIRETTSNFGYSLTTTDFNIDGKIDLAIGGNIYNSSQGRVYVYATEIKTSNTAVRLKSKIKFRGSVRTQ